MKVKVPVVFEVEGLEGHAPTTQESIGAIHQTIENYLVLFVPAEEAEAEADGDWVEVEVDGYGKCRVRMPE